MNVEEMLDKALEIIHTLEMWADTDTQRDINELFDAVNQRNDSDPEFTANMEAQDHSIFGDHKI